MTPTRIDVFRPHSVPPLSVGMRDAVRLVGISECRLQQLVAAGEVPHVRIDRRIVLRVAALDARLASRETGGHA